ncbi:MAG: hypothetical protein AAGI17_01965 [Planctomycetota bacterium]
MNDKARIRELELQVERLQDSLSAASEPPGQITVWLGSYGESGELSGPRISAVWVNDNGDPDVGIPGWCGYVADWSTVAAWDGSELEPID